MTEMKLDTPANIAAAFKEIGIQQKELQRDAFIEKMAHELRNDFTENFIEVLKLVASHDAEGIDKLKTFMEDDSE